MANTVKLKRSATPGAVPTTAQLALGELAMNTYDGKVYMVQNNGTASVIQVGGGAGTVTSVAATVPTGLTVSGSPITTSGTLAISFTTGYSIPTTASQGNWDTAYSQRYQWDGGSTNLVAATGRTSLGGTTVGQNFFTLTNPTAVTFPRINADNTVSALDAATFRTAIGAGTSSTTGTVTSITAGTGLSGGTITTSGTIALANTAVTAGSYTNTNITVDAQGRITAASSGSAGGVTTFSAGTTGFTPSTATTGAITLGGTLNVANGGTGATTLSGLVYGNGTSAMTAATAAQVVSVIGSTAVTNATNATNATTATSATTATTATTANALNTGNSYTAVNLTATGYVKGGSNANPNTPTNYGLQASGSYGGGLAFTDGSGNIGLYSTGSGGQLNIAFGASGSMGPVNYITSNGLHSANGGFQAESTGPFFLNANTVSANYTIPANYNASSAGPITVNTGVTVTVSTGSTWVIV